MNTPALNKAMILALAAHTDQVDKLGKPYIFHPMAVAADPLLTEETDMVVALLHDVMEDCGVTWVQLNNSFGTVVADAVQLLTRKKGESPDVYYTKIKASPLALKVKLADIRHNISPARLNHLDEATRKRLAHKYKHALAMLTGKTDCPAFVMDPDYETQLTSIKEDK